MSGSKKIVIYRTGDRTGFGNKCRGIVSAYLLSVLLERNFILDCDAIQNFFDTPAELDWTCPSDFYEKYKGKILQIDPAHRHSEKDLILQKDLNTVWSNEVICHQQGNAFVYHLVANPYYRPLIIKLYGTDQLSQLTCILTNKLFNNPKPFFKKLIEERKETLGWKTVERWIGIQFRVFHDVGFRNQKLVPMFLENVRNVLSHHYSPKSLIFITTDSLKLTKEMVTYLAKLGYNAVYSNHPVKHTGLSGSAVEPVIDWYLLGETDLLLTTFTTFSIFAAARTNNRPTIYKINGKYQGLITENEYGY